MKIILYILLIVFISNCNKVNSAQNVKNIILARQLAIDAGAAKFYKSELEDNDEQLKSKYLNLELRSIKHQFLADSKRVILKAVNDGAKKYNPEKLSLTLRSLKDTLDYIDQNRHNDDQIKERSRIVAANAKQLLESTHVLADLEKYSPIDSIADDSVSSLQSGIEKSNLENIKNHFSSNEAEVVKQGSSIILRLKGIKFPTAKNFIQSENFKLLGKVQSIIKSFPDSSIVIEGHTDSSGREADNTTLSRDRANSIREYFLSTNLLPANRMMIVGFGDINPISSNNTTEGRAQNRRVDIIINYH